MLVYVSDSTLRHTISLYGFHHTLHSPHRQAGQVENEASYYLPDDITAHSPAYLACCPK